MGGRRSRGSTTTVPGDQGRPSRPSTREGRHRPHGTPSGSQGTSFSRPRERRRRLRPAETVTVRGTMTLEGGFVGVDRTPSRKRDALKGRNRYGALGRVGVDTGQGIPAYPPGRSGPTPVPTFYHQGTSSQEYWAPRPGEGPSDVLVGRPQRAPIPRAWSSPSLRGPFLPCPVLSPPAPRPSTHLIPSLGSLLPPPPPPLLLLSHSRYGPPLSRFVSPSVCLASSPLPSLLSGSPRLVRLRPSPPWSDS